ncbi:Fc receptor-like protein 5 [Alosa pseudoharengus]|uniref:Fc receptor-like protein 5 n=1 Tax=Alosa pseudoharengus TaxID=34774 RepID=UPI003F8A1223
MTLRCEVTDTSSNWTFLWYKAVSYRHDLPSFTYRGKYYFPGLLPDSSRGAGGSFTLSLAAPHHNGLYVCRAEGGDPAYQTQFSDVVPLWVLALSRPASLVIRPNRSQHFTHNSLSLSCEVPDNSTGWTLRWRTKRREGPACPDGWESEAGSTCSTTSPVQEDSGEYWCGSESGDSNPVNITVTSGDVILESPAHPVTEGDPLTLCCLSRNNNSTFSADFYKDGSLLQSQTTGVMTIPAVSKAHQGLYKCRHPELGESPESPVMVFNLSPPASVVIRPNRSQHFTHNSLSLSCEVPDNSTEWTLRWRTKRREGPACPDGWESEAGSTCSTTSPVQEDSGEYWCGSESGGRSNPVNITVTSGDVILESPAHPVTEGDPLTLRCLSRNNNSTFSADFYRDGSLLPSQTTGEMTIPAVSKAHQGLYKCRHPELGESPESPVMVFRSDYPASPFSVFRLVCSVPVFSLTIMLVVQCFRSNSQSKVDDEEERTYEVSEA